MAHLSSWQTPTGSRSRDHVARPGGPVLWRILSADARCARVVAVRPMVVFHEAGLLGVLTAPRINAIRAKIGASALFGLGDVIASPWGPVLRRVVVVDAWDARPIAIRIMVVLLVAPVTLVLATPALQAILMRLRAHIPLENFAAPWRLVLWLIAVVDANLARPMATRVMLVLLEARVSFVLATLGVHAILVRSRALLACGREVAADP